MIDLDEYDQMYVDDFFCRSDLRDLIKRLREAEKDAERWRRMYDSALHEAKKQYEWRMEDSGCGGNEVMEGLYMLECRVIDKAIKEKGDE